MKITAECAIDLDERRKVWVSVTAEGESLAVAKAAAEAAAEGAFKAYTAARGRRQRSEDDGIPAAMGELD